MKTNIRQITMFKRGIMPMKKILFFTLFIFTIQSLSANSISVQGVLRDNNNRAVQDKEEGYNMTFTIRMKIRFSLWKTLSTFTINGCRKSQLKTS